MLGPLLIVSGPSGVGKTLFIKKSLKTFSKLSNTCSWTTRTPRKTEKQGEFYHFTTREKFHLAQQKGAFLEWAKVHQELYATTIQSVYAVWEQGLAIIKDIDVQGCKSIKKIFPKSVSVFIYPPSIQELKNRIIKRQAQNSQQIKYRLDKAIEEMTQGQSYDFQITNDSFDTAWLEFQNILTKLLDDFYK